MPRRWTLSSCIVHRLDTPLLPPFLRANHIYFYPPLPLLSSPPILSSNNPSRSSSINFLPFLPIELEDECITISLLSISSIYIYISLSSWMEKQLFLPNLWGILDSSGLRNAGRGPVFPSPGATRLHSFRDFGRSFSLRRSMERGFSAGFPFLAGRRRGESLVPAGSLSFTFHAGREPAKPGRKGPRGRKPAARHGCTTKLARRVPVLSVSPRAWDDSTILYLAPTDPFPSLDGILNWQDATNRRSRVVDRQIAFDPRGIKRFEPSVDGENRDRDRSRLKIMRANLKKEGEETLLRCLQ